MSGLNIDVVVQAHKEYLKQLQRILTPIIQEGFFSIMNDAYEQNEEDNKLRQFQIYLKQIPKWNQSILDIETKRIKEKIPYLMDLVTAVFVSQVKILASVRLGGSHKNIKIKIPTSEIFIHSVYIRGAERFYYNPHIFEDTNDREKLDKIHEGIDIVIGDVIDTMIPIKEILEEYLCSTFTDHTIKQPEDEPPPPNQNNHSREINATDIIDDEPMDTFLNRKNTVLSAEAISPPAGDLLLPVGPEKIDNSFFPLDNSLSGLFENNTENTSFSTPGVDPPKEDTTFFSTPEVDPPKEDTTFFSTPEVDPPKEDTTFFSTPEVDPPKEDSTFFSTPEDTPHHTTTDDNEMTDLFKDENDGGGKMFSFF